VDDLDYELLAWLEGGHFIFWPQEVAAGCDQPFLAVVARLLRLRDQGLVAFLDSHVAKTESGTYLMVGPVQLRPAAIARSGRTGG
jgi:hypothetical protein